MFPWLIFPFSDYQRDCMHTTLALSNPCCTQQRFFDIGHRMSCVLTSFDRGTRAQRLRVADRPAVTIDDVLALHPDSPANRYRWQSDSKPKIKLTVYYWTKIIGFKCCFVVFRLLKFFFFYHSLLLEAGEWPAFLAKTSSEKASGGSSSLREFLGKVRRFIPQSEL